MRRTILIPLVLVALAGLSACSNSNPAAPSGLSGVTINGSVVAPGSSNVSTHMGPQSAGPTVVPPGLTVSVNGTNNTAQVNAAGRFALLNVPPGNVDLRFNAPGVLATVTVTDLQSGQTVDLTVNLTDTDAQIDSDHRSLGREEQLEGRVESLPPTTAALTLVVAGRTVKTDSSTTFYLGGALVSFASLEIGQRVHVKGQTSGDSLLARSVDIQNTNTSVGVNLNGTISNLTGPSTAFEFDVAGRHVKGDAATAFIGNSQFSDLVNGARVEVHGTQRDGFVYADRVHVNGGGL